MKFKLLHGAYIDESNRRYSARTPAEGHPIVESSRPLDEMYLNMFERVDGPTATPEEKIPADSENTTKVDGGANTITFIAKKREKGNRYDVVKLVGGTETGEKVNKRPLSEEQARELALQANQAGQ